MDFNLIGWNKAPFTKCMRKNYTLKIALKANQNLPNTSIMSLTKFHKRLSITWLFPKTLKRSKKWILCFLIRKILIKFLLLLYHIWTNKKCLCEILNKYLLNHSIFALYDKPDFLWNWYEWGLSEKKVFEMKY